MGDQLRVSVWHQPAPGVGHDGVLRAVDRAEPTDHERPEPGPGVLTRPRRDACQDEEPVRAELR